MISRYPQLIISRMAIQRGIWKTLKEYRLEIFIAFVTAAVIITVTVLNVRWLLSDHKVPIRYALAKPQMSAADFEALLKKHDYPPDIYIIPRPGEKPFYYDAANNKVTLE